MVFPLNADIGISPPYPLLFHHQAAARDLVAAYAKVEIPKKDANGLDEKSDVKLNMTAGEYRLVRLHVSKRGCWQQLKLGRSFAKDFVTQR